MANKFKIKLKLTGFELEIEGSREDVPFMAQAVGQQMSGLLLPASNIVEGEIIENKDLPQLASEAKPKSRKKRSSRQYSQTSTNSTLNGKAKALAVDWKHDPSKWGNPQQDWSTTDKSMWLLYVVQIEAEVLELTGSEISTTFNKHFRQSGQISTSQINRDLGRAKGKKPALVSDNATKSPSAWFLTTEGEKCVQQLIAQARGQIQND
ncbi:MAG: hypothetical protein V7L04_28335 [Nostoc sp.]|uniref:hypothetical protein n=2 Tax=Nostoc TaxID=1177 RepID=UPI002FFB704D